MSQMMFTEPKIVFTEVPTSRSYVIFYYNGKRFREYNGKKLKLDINPNYASTLADRKRLLSNLQFEFKKALQSGWSPFQININKDVVFEDAMKETLADKLMCPYSKTYKRDLEKLHDQVLSFLPKPILKQYVCSIDCSYFDNFLSQFKSSNRHYMNKRRTLSVFFSAMVKKGYINNNIIQNTNKLRVKSVLHEPYSNEELKKVLDFLKQEYSNLYLCCLITYGCLLRPHQEIRLLKRKHITYDFTQIHLSGSENKSGRVRTVYLPQYITEELRNHLFDCNDMEANVFTLSKCAYNDDYFKTQWSRAKVEMLKMGLIRNGQTLYSFRHTAAINVYRKTKDLHVLQQLLQHSNMVVTLNYLRGLGEINDERLKEFLPEL